MSKKATWLSEYRANIHSQAGEDGVISKILETLPVCDQWCVEFGAWDGIFYTNTRNLIMQKGYSAVLIEGSKKRFELLQRNYLTNKCVYPMCRYVGVTDDNNLDVILKETPIPTDFDFLSIDIDGNDYHVWKAFSVYRPKVIVIEFNSTIPTEIDYVQASDPNVSQGSSLLALVNLGRDKGYELVCALQFNAFFVRKEYFKYFDIADNSPETLRTDLSMITQLFVGFDGQIFLRGACRLPWHETPIRPERIQYLPRYLRRHAGDYSVLDKVVFALWLIKEDPRRLIREVVSRVSKLIGKPMSC